MPRPASPARIRGSSQSGHVAVTASRAGRTAWWTTPRASDGSSSSLLQDGSRAGGGVGAHAGSRAEIERMIELPPESTRPCDRRVTPRVSRPVRRDSSRAAESPRRPRLTTRIRRSYPRARCRDPQAPDAPEARAPNATARGRRPRRRRRTADAPSRASRTCPSRASRGVGSRCCSRALVAAWVIVLFARQVGEASEASTRADAMRAAERATGGRRRRASRTSSP